MNASAQVPGIDAGVQILVEHGFEEGEAYALLADDHKDSSFNAAWNKLRRQVPEADDFFGPVFHRSADPELNSDPELVATRLQLSDDELKTLGDIEKSLS